LKYAREASFDLTIAIRFPGLPLNDGRRRAAEISS
jgi:hypothetical protein